MHRAGPLFSELGDRARRIDRFHNDRPKILDQISISRISVPGQLLMIWAWTLSLQSRRTKHNYLNPITAKIQITLNTTITIAFKMITMMSSGAVHRVLWSSQRPMLEILSIVGQPPTLHCVTSITGASLLQCDMLLKWTGMARGRTGRDKYSNRKL